MSKEEKGPCVTPDPNSPTGINEEKSKGYPKEIK